jgi:hypothetical protein
VKSQRELSDKVRRRELEYLVRYTPGALYREHPNGSTRLFMLRPWVVGRIARCEKQDGRDQGETEMDDRGIGKQEDRIEQQQHILGVHIRNQCEAPPNIGWIRKKYNVKTCTMEFGSMRHH